MPRPLTTRRHSINIQYPFIHSESIASRQTQISIWRLGPRKLATTTIPTSGNRGGGIRHHQHGKDDANCSRRTGITLKEGRRDEHGMEELDGMFSSPERSVDEGSEGMSMDEGTSSIFIFVYFLSFLSFVFVLMITQETAPARPTFSRARPRAARPSSRPSPDRRARAG